MYEATDPNPGKSPYFSCGSRPVPSHPGIMSVKTPVDQLPNFPVALAVVVAWRTYTLSLQMK